MSLRKPNKNTNNFEVIKNINNTNPLNFSHRNEQENTSFELQEVTLEDLDLMVINYFDNYFTIDGKKLRLINGMIDYTSIKFIYPEVFNKEKETIIKPLFTIKRTGVSPRGRSNPSFKPSVYIIPQMKAQGLVYTEYVVRPAKYIDVTYEFMFISTFKESVNEVTEQVVEYFKNKRNIIHFGSDRFTLRTNGSIDSLFKHDEKEHIAEPKEFILNFSLTLEGFLRGKDSIIKRELPNSYTVEFKTTHGENFNMETISKNVYNLERKKS